MLFVVGAGFLSHHGVRFSLLDLSLCAKLTRVVCLAIYVDSMLFVFLTAILRFGTGITKERDLCDGAIVVCKSGLTTEERIAF